MPYAGEQIGRIGPLEEKFRKSRAFRDVSEEGRITPTHWHVAIANGLGWAFDGMDIAIFGMIAPLVIKDFGLSLVDFRSGAQIMGLGGVIGGFVWPWLADRYGRRTLLAINIALFSLLMPVVASAPTWLIYVGAYLFVRFTLAGEWAIGATLVAETWPARLRGLVLGANRSAFSLGTAFAGLLTTYVAAAFGWREALLVPGLVALLAVYIRFLCPESPEWVRAQDRRQRLRTALAEGGTVSDTDRQWLDKRGRLEFRQLFMKDIRLNTLLVTLVNLGMNLSFSTMTFFMPLYLSESHGWSTTEYGMFLTWWGLVGIPAYWIAGGLSDRFGRRPAFAVCLLSSALFLALWAYLDGRPELWIIGLIWSFLYAGNYGPLAAYLSEMFPTRVRSSGVGFATAVGTLVSFVLWPFVLVWLREATGSFRSGFITSAVILVAVAAIVWFASPENARKALGTISI